MKKLLFIAIMSTLNIHFVFGQSEGELTLQLYSQSIETFFTQIINNNKLRDKFEKPQFTLIKDSLPHDLPLNYQGFNIKIVKDLSAGIRELDNHHIKNGAIYTITRKFKKDTLDVTISNWVVSIKKGLYFKHGRLFTKRISFFAECSGTMGYIPTGRLVHDYALNQWEYYTYQELLDRKQKNQYAIYQ